MNQGWIKVWRKIWDDELFRERRVFSRFEAWVDILLMADHTERNHLIDGERIICNRGEFPTSERFLENRWRWSRKKVRAFLKDLELDEKVNKNATTKGTIIHIINYDTYQSKDTTKDTIEEPLRIPQKNQIQELKNEKKNIYGEFQNVRLLEEEFQKLIKKFGEQGSKDRIENLSQYIASKGKKYSSHYATILSWDRKNKGEVKNVKSW